MTGYQSVISPNHGTDAAGAVTRRCFQTQFKVHSGFLVFSDKQKRTICSANVHIKAMIGRVLQEDAVWAVESGDVVSLV